MAGVTDGLFVVSVLIEGGIVRLLVICQGSWVYALDSRVRGNNDV
jgi:hypothetical protein